MTPAARDMPRVRAVWLEGHGWIVTLPDGRERVCLDRELAMRVIDSEACGSSISWIGGPRPTSRSTPEHSAVLGAGGDEARVSARRPRSHTVVSGSSPSPRRRRRTSSPSTRAALGG